MSEVASEHRRVRTEPSLGTRGWKEPACETRCHMCQACNSHRLQVRLLKPEGNHGATSKCSDFADEKAEAQKSEESCTWSRLLANFMEQPLMLYSQLFRPLANGADALLALEFPGLISVRQALWNPVPGTLPGIGMNFLGSPRPLSLLANFPTRVLEVCQNIRAFQRALAPSQSRPLRRCKFLSPVWFPSQAQPCWAHKSPSSGLREGGVALLHGKIKPFVREQGPIIRQANRVGA